MTMEKIGTKNKGLALFGIVLLAIGLLAYFYYYPTGYAPNQTLHYPYQTAGIVLVIAGIVFVALGFFYSPKKPLTSQTT